LVRDAAGNLYGTTEGGGVNACGGAGCGVVFKLDTSGKETVLHTFTGPDGALPELAGLVMDASGNLYGVTYVGGTVIQICPPGCGVIYKVDTGGNETVLYNFTGGADGADPSETLLLDQSGNLYGTALFGGTSGLGTAFKFGAPFSLSASALTPNAVSPGGSASSTISMTASSSFRGNVSLTCSVQPSPALAPKCSLSANAISSGGSATLNVTTYGTSAGRLLDRKTFLALWLPLLALSLADVRLDLKQRRKEALSLIVVALLLITGLFSTSSCGAGSNAGGGNGGTPSGSYTISVTGTSSSSQLSSSTNMVLTVR
jgi:uncharacterized repeat protein (TIGR03803 family)